MTEHRLRRDVDRFAGCLDALPGVEGRLLAIRAGVGSAEPTSLPDAAGLLGISTQRAVRIQRRGLRHLRAAGRSGACGSGAAAERRSAALGTSGATIPPLQPTVLLAQRPQLTSTAMLARPSHRGGTPNKLRIASPEATAQATAARAPAALDSVKASSKTAAYLAALGLLGLLVMALVVAWRRREQTVPARLSEQTGTAAVWWPPTPTELPPAPAEPPPVAAEVSVQPLLSDHSTGADSSTEGVDPVAAAEPAPPASHRARRPRPAAVAAASVVSLGLALLRRRRR